MFVRHQRSEPAHAHHGVIRTLVRFLRTAAAMLASDGPITRRRPCLPVRRSIRPHHLLLLSAALVCMAGSHVLESRSRQILEESTRQHPSLDASTARANAVLEGLPLAFEPAGAGQDHFVVRAGAAKADVRHNGLTILERAEASSRI